MSSSLNKPTHVTRGDVLDDLGLSSPESSALKIKATLLDAVLEEIERKAYSQKQLVVILDEYQPSVSNLLRGRIGRVSIEKLLGYSDRLHLHAQLTVSGRSGFHTRRTNRKLHPRSAARRQRPASTVA